MAITNTGLTLVTGGTGKTGRRLAERLTEAGFAVRIGSRSAEPAFDWDKPATWGPALAGVEAAYIAFQPDIAVPGAVGTVRAFCAAAVARGVKRLVLLSGRGEPEAVEAEQVVQRAGVPWTILRSSWFCQNFSEGFFVDPILAGDVALPVRAVPEPFVDAEDIADVAFVALTHPGHENTLYEITGPSMLTFEEAIREIAHATGREIGFVEVPADAYGAALVQAGVPAEFIDLILYLFTTVLDGRNASLGDGVQRALKRAPRSFSDYVRRAAATGVWNA